MVLFAPLPVKLLPKAYREPDLIFNFAAHHAAQKKEYYERADFVMEVVSAGKRDRIRDYEEKREIYAKAGISEYWIVDPATQCVTVLHLQRGAYVEHDTATVRGAVSSRLLDGFSVDVAEVFAAGRA